MTGLFMLACPLISVHTGRLATVGFTGQDLAEAFLPLSLHCQSLQMFLLPWIPPEKSLLASCLEFGCPGNARRTEQGEEGSVVFNI